MAKGKGNKLERAIAGLDRVIASFIATEDKTPPNVFHLPRDLEYQDVLQEIFAATESLRHVSEREIERRIDNILMIVRKSLREGAGADEATLVGRAGASDFLKLLRSKPSPWFIHLRVNNVAPKGLPYSVANVTLNIGDEAQLAQMQGPGHAVIEATASTEQQKLSFKKSFSDWLQREFSGRVIATVAVQALDEDAAKRLARDSVRIALDLLNFCRSLLPYPVRSWAYTDADAMPTRTISVAFRGPHDQPDRLSMPIENVGTLGQMEVEALKGPKAVARGVTQLLAIGGKTGRTRVEEKVVTAARLAGAALTRQRRDHAFLLNMIALESLFLGEPSDEVDGPLMYRLRLACARLLGVTVDDRQRVSKLVRRLYARRSAIVHQGQVEVPEIDVDAAEGLIQGCLRRILTTPALLQRDSLIIWLDEQLLS